MALVGKYKTVFLDADSGQSPAGVAVRAGDVIRIEYQFAPHSGSLSVGVTNLTRGGGAGFATPGFDARPGTIEMGDGPVSPDGFALAIPNFGSHVVRHVGVDGHNLAGDAATQTTLVDEEGVALIEPSAPKHHASQFTLTYAL